MNRFFTILFLIPCAIFAQENISVLTVGSSGSITVKSEANINLAGLELSPSSDLVISETDLTRSSAPIVSEYDDSSVSRVYSSTSLISNFVGSLTTNIDMSIPQAIVKDKKPTLLKMMFTILCILGTLRFMALQLLNLLQQLKAFFTIYITHAIPNIFA